jgi:hypothetical protein
MIEMDRNPKLEHRMLCPFTMALIGEGEFDERMDIWEKAIGSETIGVCWLKAGSATLYD